MKWKITGFLILLVSVVFLVAAVVVSSPEKEKEKESPTPLPLTSQIPDGSTQTTIDTLPKGPNEVDVPDKAVVHVIKGGWLELSSNDSLTVSSGTLEEDVPKNARFVLVPDSLTLGQKDIEKLKEYLDEKRTVLFYGKKVDAQAVLAHLGVEEEPIVLESNATLTNFLYGYGYSEEYGAFMQVFSPSNTVDEEVLTSYVETFVFNKRGY